MTGLRYENLDDETRRQMTAEINADIAAGRTDPARGLYISNYLSPNGVRLWPGFLSDAARAGSDISLAAELNRHQCFKAQVERRKPTGGFTMVRVPVTAAETLSEAQFNMYYMRALSVRAIELGVGLVVYRAKSVDVPRRSSEEMIGMTLDPQAVLTALRETRGVEPLTNIPLPNTGITVRLGSR